MSSPNRSGLVERACPSLIKPGPSLTKDLGQKCISCFLDLFSSKKIINLIKKMNFLGKKLIFNKIEKKPLLDNVKKTFIKRIIKKGCS